MKVASSRALLGNSPALVLLASVNAKVRAWGWHRCNVVVQDLSVLHTWSHATDSAGRRAAEPGFPQQRHQRRHAGEQAGQPVRHLASWPGAATPTLRAQLPRSQMPAPSCEKGAQMHARRGMGFIRA